METSKVFALLAPAHRHDQSQGKLVGRELASEGKMFEVANGIAKEADQDCLIDVILRTDNDISQTSEFREGLLSFIRAPDLDGALFFGQSLASVTTTVSGIGLLFLIHQVSAKRHKIILARFPTTAAIRADLDSDVLTVDYLESVFVKNRKTYKAAIFEGLDAKGEMLTCRIVDKQINLSSNDASRYWVTDFLKGDFATTSDAGTRRLARAIMQASRKAGPLEKQELHHAAALAANLGGKAVSIDSFMNQFSLSDSTRKLIEDEVEAPLRAETFIFGKNEYGRHIALRSIELDNGVIVTAESARFQELVEEQVVTDTMEGPVVRLTATGVIVNDRLRRRAS